MNVQTETKAKRSPVDVYIRKKMKILKDFTVVNKDNEVEIERMLYEAVERNPFRIYELAVDEVARRLIKKKLDEYEEMEGN